MNYFFYVYLYTFTDLAVRDHDFRLVRMKRHDKVEKPLLQVQYFCKWNTILNNNDIEDVLGERLLDLVNILEVKQKWNNTAVSETILLLLLSIWLNTTKDVWM
jgi:hypothetical protein